LLYEEKPEIDMYLTMQNIIGISHHYINSKILTKAWIITIQTISFVGMHKEHLHMKFLFGKRCCWKHIVITHKCVQITLITRATTLFFSKTN